MATTLPQTTSSPKFDNTLGAILIGGLACAVLYGVTCLQTFIYFQRYPRDRLSLKTFVSCLWVLDTFDFFLTSHILYWYLVTNFINPKAILKPVWSILIHVAITSLSDFLVRSMFARRVWKLSNRNVLLTSIIVAISLLDFVCGMIITVKAFSVDSFPDLESISTLFYVNFASGLSGDLSVALALCYYLWKSRTGFTRTNSLINTLILYVINTGLLTALNASAGLIAYAVQPNNFIFIAFYLQLSKLYLNSYLASLNVRKGLRGSQHSEGAVSIHLSRISESLGQPRTSPESSLTAVSEKPAGPMPVKVETNLIVVHREDDMPETPVTVVNAYPDGNTVYAY